MGTNFISSGATEFTFSFGPDNSGSLEEIVRRFNKKFEGRYRANYRVMAADTGQYFNQVKTEFQAGGGEIDLIGGDVVWPAQFAIAERKRRGLTGVCPG
jgi:multiple sugar transport system substrate-binding protein